MSELNNLLKRVIKDKGNFVSMEKAAELLIELEDIQHQLEIQTKRVENLKKSNEFYSNEGSWTVDGHTHHEEAYYVREHGEFSVTIRQDVDPAYRYGGKLARSCQAIDQELEKQLEEVNVR